MYDSAKTIIHIVLAFLVHFCAALFVILRFWIPLSVKRPLKVIGTLLTLVAYAAPYGAVLFDRITDFQLPTVFYVTSYCVTFIFVLFPAAFVAFRDLISLLLKLTRRKRHTPPISTDRRQALAFFGASAGLTGLGMHHGLRVPDVNRIEASFETLPQALEGLKVVQLSDIHASTLLPKEHIVSIVETVNALEPDLILITGDIADGVIPVRIEDLSPLSGLTAPLGVFGCEGNHEHYVDDYEERIRHYEKLGIRILRNECVQLQHQGCSFTVAGVTDLWAHRKGREAPNPLKAFHTAPSTGFRVLMAHQPGQAHLYAQVAQYDWQLSGHTHGGQMLLMDLLVNQINNGRLKGWYNLGRTKLYVHSGTGTASRYPLRLGVPGEIAFFVLRRT